MAQLAKLILRRLLGGVLLILAVVVFDFLLVHLAPGGPAETLAGQMGGATPQVLAQIRHAYGLDRPLPVQLLTYIGHVAQGDFGKSFYFNQPVLSLVLQRLPATLLLIICAQLSRLIRLVRGELTVARSGGLDADLLAQQPFYGTNYTKPLLFIEDGNYFSSRAQAEHLTGSQWGVMNETGSYPGQPWLWLYTLWYQLPGFRSSDNVDLIAIYLTGAATLLLLAVPFVPGLRDVPRLVPVHRLVQAGAAVDGAGLGHEQLEPDTLTGILKAHPRLGFLSDMRGRFLAEVDRHPEGVFAQLEHAVGLSARFATNPIDGL